jgi:hypothetical protein
VLRLEDHEQRGPSARRRDRHKKKRQKLREEVEESRAELAGAYDEGRRDQAQDDVEKEKALVTQV